MTCWSIGVICRDEGISRPGAKSSAAGTIDHAVLAYGLPLVRRMTPRRRDHSIDLNGLAVSTRRLGGRDQLGSWPRVTPYRSANIRPTSL